MNAIRRCQLGIAVVGLGVVLGPVQAFAQLAAPTPSVPPPPAPAISAGGEGESLEALLRTNLTPIDLASVLRLAGVQNSEILVARQRVLEALAARQLAAAQFLPTLNAGTSFNGHQGTIQQADGTIIHVNRESLYAGAGAFTVGAGTMNIPGVVLAGNPATGIFEYLVARQTVDLATLQSQTVQQDRTLDAAIAYAELVRSEGQRGVALRTLSDAREAARLTAAYLQTGTGRKADADRAATEYSRRQADIFQVEGTIGTASARLCRFLHLDPTLRLHATDQYVLPESIVPEPIGLPELIAVALLNRPELKERRVDICRALLRLQEAHWLPFSPTVYIAYSTGVFGGGGSLASAPPLDEPRFGSFDGRQDFDAMAYWTLLNLGVGNRAQIDAARSRLRTAELREIEVLDRIRAEVATAYARTHARYAQIKTFEMAIEAAQSAYREDLNRIIGHKGLPLELLDSLRLLAESRAAYLNAIVDYNIAQFELYVAIGRPPADLLLRPATGVEPLLNKPAVPPEPQ